MAGLEDAFHRRMLELGRRCYAHNYPARGFLQKVNEVGGVAAAKYWLHQPKTPGDSHQSGLDTLWEMAHDGRWPTALEESMEYVVSREREWRPLFTTDERHIADLRYRLYIEL